MQYLMVFITTPSKKEAQRISKTLLDKKLIACANIIPNIDSYFWWNKRINTARERLLIVKTKKALLKRLFKVVKANHSYRVPELIAIPIVYGYKPYLDWIRASLENEKGASE